jgi:hypothetical protein
MVTHLKGKIFLTTGIILPLATSHLALSLASQSLPHQVVQWW